MELEKGEVVQLNPETVRNKGFAGCFLVVTDLKSFGCQGYVQGLGTREAAAGQAYYRAEFAEIVKLENGKAPFIIGD